MAYRAVLPFRPTNVVHQLGAEGAFPLMNGREVLRFFGGWEGVLWVPRVTRPERAQGFLRAAAHLRAVVGLALVVDPPDEGELRRGVAPAPFLRQLLQAAGQVERIPPLVFHVEEPPLSRVEGPEFGSVQAHLARCVEAGFTSFGVDLSGCEADQCEAAIAGLLAPVLELELGWTVRLGFLTEDRDPDPAALRSRIAQQLAALGRGRLHPDLVLLPGPDLLGDEAFGLAQEMAPMAAPAGIGWQEVPGSEVFAEARALRASFVRALVGGGRIDAPAGGGPVPQANDQQEAALYLESSRLLERLGAAGTAERFAAELPGLIR